MFLEVFKQHNEKAEDLIGKDYAPATLIKYNTCYSSLQSFVKQKYKEENIPLVKLNYEFITDFEFFLKTQQVCVHNTVMGLYKES